MCERPEKTVYIEHLVKRAVERWGQEEVDQLRSALERIADAIWLVDGFKMEPNEEPAKPVGER